MGSIPARRAGTAVRFHRRAAAKAVTWRLLGLVLDATLIYVLSGSAGLALGIGAVDNVIKLVMYYFHERAWARTPQ